MNARNAHASVHDTPTVPPPPEQDVDETQPFRIPTSGVIRVSALRDVVLQKYRSGEFSAALAAAELTLTAEPTNDEVLAIAESCRIRLCRLLANELGTARVPRLAIDPAAVEQLTAGPMGAFVISRIDGVSTVEEVVDACGLPAHQTLDVLCTLHRAGAIALD